jgi:hypothetical protein
VVTNQQQKAKNPHNLYYARNIHKPTKLKETKFWNDNDCIKRSALQTDKQMCKAG